MTIAIPIHNEEEVLPELLRRVFAVLDQTPGGPHELSDRRRRKPGRVVADPGRGRRNAIHACASSCCRRNFGHQAAVSAAFDHASGDVMMVMDGDLQDCAGGPADSPQAAR